MAMATAPFVLKDVSVTLKPKDALPAAAEYRCQLSAATITPAAGSAGGGATYETFCATFSNEGTSGATFTLDLAGFQAWTDVADLTALLWNNAGQVYEFLLVPIAFEADGTTPKPIGPTNYGFKGFVTLVEPQAGGTANQYATFTVSLPCTEKPELLTAPPAAQAA